MKIYNEERKIGIRSKVCAEKKKRKLFDLVISVCLIIFFFSFDFVTLGNT